MPRSGGSSFTTVAACLQYSRRTLTALADTREPALNLLRVNLLTTPMRATFKKFQRNPKAAESWHPTERSLAILELLYRYRFLPTPLLAHLIGGNIRVTYEHTKQLFHAGLIQRFTLPSPPDERGHYQHGDFYHYLTSTKALDFLEARGRAEQGSLNRRLIKQNLAAKFHDPTKPHLFLRHDSLLSLFRGYLTLAAATTRATTLAQWEQGSHLNRSVVVPEAAFDRRRNRWLSLPTTEELPLRPDAFFTLAFHGSPPELDHHFFLEVDCDTETIPRIIQKLRAYFHFIVNQKRHWPEYRVPLIRAVLILTTTQARAEELRQAASDYATLIGFAAPSKLFWFQPATVFLQSVVITKHQRAQNLAAGLLRPELLMEQRWLSPRDDTPQSLIDRPDAAPLLQTSPLRVAA